MITSIKRINKMPLRRQKIAIRRIIDKITRKYIGYPVNVNTRDLIINDIKRALAP